MDQKEYEALLASIQKMIETSLLGSRRGNHFRILGGLEEAAHQHDRLYGGSGGFCGNQYLDANAREDRAKGTVE